MTEFSARYSDTPRKKNRIAQYKWAVIAGIALSAILFQVYVPRFVSYLSFLELPLLVTVYFALMRRSPTLGVFLGSLIGLAQDSLSSNPLGMFGIVKTLVGYFAATVSQRFDVETSGARLVLAFFFFVFHQFFYWVLGRALLGQPITLDLPQTLLMAALNALVAVPLYHILDKLRVTE
jgi:rod shape-determining protein MreD